MRLIELASEVKDRLRTVKDDPECDPSLSVEIVDALIALGFESDQWAEIERLEG